jgi:uncharacterized delta-60 repeat protein
MKRGLLVCVFLLALPATAAATPGDIDPTFSQDGFKRVGFGDDRSAATAVAIDAEGRLVIAGTTGPVNGFSDYQPSAVAVARLTADGKLDRSFSEDGRATFDIGPSPQVVDVANGPGGTIVIGASAGADLVALRLAADGTPDPSFSSDGVAAADAGGTERGGSLLVDPDGTATVGGPSCFASSCRFGLVRFTPAGGLDSSFDGDGIVVTSFPDDFVLLNDLARTPGGGLLAAGDTGFREAALAEYTPSGALDPAFNGGGQAVISANTQGARAVAVDAANRILAMGQSGAFYRVTADGSIDLSFSLSYLYGQAFTIDGANRVVAAGRLGGCSRGCTPVDTVLARADAETGAIDETFGQDQFGHLAFADLGAQSDGAAAVAVDSADRPLIGGFSGDKMVAARFENAPGPPDRDGDEVVDAADRCPTILGKLRDGCPRAKRKLTLHRNKGADLWKGRIKSNQDRCNAGQTVRVFRKRAGKDEHTETATSDDSGHWSADGNLRRGTYYARIERQFKPRYGTCVKAKSHAVTIRR